MDTSSTEKLATVLLVDDEPNILSSLKRIFRNEPYRVVTAGGGEEGLEVLERTPVDLVISDARMPGMDGASFLAEVQRRWPERLRILLTGYADIGTTVKAINEGRIYRYISKPWDDMELRSIVRQALEYQFAERERQRLERLTQEQNRCLQELNATLEQRVRDRTAELQQTADMLDLAYSELSRSYVMATEVFATLIGRRFSKARQTNTAVVALMKAMAMHLDLSAKDTDDLVMAAALYNIGKLTWTDQLLGKPSDLAYGGDREQFRKYPSLGESLLMTLEPVQDAARLIRHHQERWDGTGFPDKLKGEAIPFGSRLLKLAIDFVEIQRGMIVERKLGRNEAFDYLEKFASRVYDPQLCDQFTELCRSKAPDLELSDPDVMVLCTADLKPGMVLARNVHADSGMMLLNEGKRLTEELIEKLAGFESSEDASYTILVRPPEKEAAHATAQTVRGTAQPDAGVIHG